MAAKFTKGDSEATTRNVTAKNPPRNVRTTSHYLKGGNTMSGMPGYIDADRGSSMDHVRGGKGVGPKREGPIGEKGGSGARHMGKGNSGTTTPNYHKTTTGRAGPIEHDTSSGHEHKHIRKTSHPMPGQKAPPISSGSITGRKVGIDMETHRARNREAAVPGGHEGHPGRMERLKGHARTSMEGRRKSSMY